MYIAPIQGNYSEALPTKVQKKGRVSNELEMYR